MAVGTNWDNSTRNVAKHRVPLVSCERSRGSLRPSSLGGGRARARAKRRLNCMNLRKRRFVLNKKASSFQGLALGKEKGFLL